MAQDENMYIANLAFFLNYDDGTSDDEIESEIFKVAFQQKETVHYDRENGGGFQNLEQEPANIATVFKFSCDIIESIYRVNQEKNNNPYIVVGSSDITVNDETYKKGDYLVTIQYRLLKNLNKVGVVSLGSII